MPLTRNPRVIGLRPTWLVAQGSIIAAGTDIGTEIEFVKPMALGLVSYSLQLYRAGTPNVAIGSPIPVALSDPNPKYTRASADLGLGIVGEWSGVTATGAPLPTLRTATSSVTTTPSTDIWSWFGTIPNNYITWVPVSDADSGWVATGRRGKATVTTSLAAPPAGFVYEAVRGQTPPGGTPTPNWALAQEFNTGATPLFPDLVYGTTADDWTSGNGAIAGNTNDFHVAARHIASGERRLAKLLSFTAEAPVSVDPVGTGAPTIDVNATGVSASAAWSDAIAKAQARITTGTAGRYVIGLPTYNYGDRTLTNLKANPGQEIAFRSITLNTGAENVGGAKFTYLRLDNCNRVHFYDVDIDREGVSSAAYNELVLVIGCKSCGLHAGRVRLCAEPGGGWLSMYVPHPLTGQYHMNPDVMKSKGNSSSDGDKAGIKLATDTKGTSAAGDDVFTEDFVLEDTLIFGPFQRAFLNSGIRTQTRRNIWEWLSGDNMQTSYGGGHITEHNWFARDINPCLRSDAKDWVHNDGSQKDAYWSGSTYVYDGCIDRGNVMMLRNIYAPTGALQLPYQGIFTSDALQANALIEDNIIITNTPTGVGLGSGAPSATNVVRRNTLLPVVDWSRQSTLDKGTWIYAYPGLNAAASVDNVQVCNETSPVPVVSSSLYLKCTRNGFSIVETEYELVRRNSSFYDARPKSGRPTHWAYTGGTKKGAWNRFDQVINQGIGVPQRGPALKSWGRQYNATAQITLP